MSTPRLVSASVFILASFASGLTALIRGDRLVGAAFFFLAALVGFDVLRQLRRGEG